MRAFLTRARDRVCASCGACSSKGSETVRGLQCAGTYKLGHANMQNACWRAGAGGSVVVIHIMQLYPQKRLKVGTCRPFTVICCSSYNRLIVISV